MKLKKSYLAILCSLLIATTTTFIFISCTSKPVNVAQQQNEIQMVNELPEHLTCKEVGEVEVKDMLQSSAIEELKNSVRDLSGNFLMVTSTFYQGPFVIYKAKAFSCK